MTERQPNAFRKRITLALAALAVIAAVQGFFAIWAVGVSERHLLRGRVAADIKQSFTDLWFYKQQLRNWMAQRQFGADATDQQRDMLLGRMQASLDRLDALARQAVMLDDGTAARQRQAQRREALVVLRASFNQLGRGLSSLNQPTPGLDTRSAWTIANDLFDNAEGRDLRALLAESLAREETALREKRAQTDSSLAALRTSWIATTRCSSSRLSSSLRRSGVRSAARCGRWSKARRRFVQAISPIASRSTGRTSSAMSPPDEYHGGGAVGAPRS